MNKAGGLIEKWNQTCEKMKPGMRIAGTIWNVIYRLRALFMAIPVVYAALKLARVNYELLPDMVGLDLLANGEYSYMVAKETAVYGPLAVTALCLLMMILSRKTLYPWVISIFSLAIPLLILVTNVFFA